MNEESIETQETDEKPLKVTGKEPEKAIKQAAMLALEQSGFSHLAISKAIGYHEKSVSRALPDLRKRSLAAPRMVKLASKTVAAVMEGYHGKEVEEPQPDGSVKKEVVIDHRVKASDAMRAAELVYSRYEPVKQDAAGSGSAPSFTSITINQQFIEGLQLPDK